MARRVIACALGLLCALEAMAMQNDQQAKRPYLSLMRRAKQRTVELSAHGLKFITEAGNHVLHQRFKVAAKASVELAYSGTASDVTYIYGSDATESLRAESQKLNHALQTVVSKLEPGPARKFLKSLRLCAPCQTYQRFGLPNDGGYVMCTDGLPQGPRMRQSVLHLRDQWLQWMRNVDVSDLKRFRQIVVEYHLFSKQEQDALNSQEYLQAVKKLEAAGLSATHLHGNNNGGIRYFDDKYSIPEVLDVTYIQTPPRGCEANISYHLPQMSDASQMLDSSPMFNASQTSGQLANNAQSLKASAGQHTSHRLLLSHSIYAIPAPNLIQADRIES